MGKEINATLGAQTILIWVILNAFFQNQLFFNKNHSGILSNRLCPDNGRPDLGSKVSADNTSRQILRVKTLCLSIH